MDDIRDTAPRFQLSAIELQEVLIHRPGAGSSEPAHFNFELSIESNVEARQKLVINMVRVVIKGDDPEKQLGAITCACIFNIPDFDQVVTMDNGVITGMNQDLAEALNSISVSTTRGVMFGELKGTFLHHAFLPVIDMEALMRSK